MRYSIFSILFLLSVATYAGDKWANLADRITPVQMQDYIARYPLFAEAAVLTKDDQMMPGAPGCPATTMQEALQLPKDIQQKCIETGGFASHVVSFIRGLCLVNDTPTPQVYNCSGEAQKMSDPYQGVGISTNQDFSNVGWVGVPGYNLFYAGDVRPDEELNYNRYQQVLQEIDSLGLYSTIQMNSKFYVGNPHVPTGMNSHDFLLMDSIGTDFGSTLRGNVYWVRVPMTSVQLDAIAAHLNAENMDFYNRRATDTLQWNIILDNCAHTVQNIFAVAGLVRAKTTENLGDTNKFKHSGWMVSLLEKAKTILTGNLAVPTNTVINIAAQTSAPEFHSLIETFNSPALKAKIAAGDPMVGPGVLVGANLMHAKNDEYLYGGTAFVLSMPDVVPLPLFNADRRRDKLYSSARMTGLEANRQYYIAHIQTLLKEGEEEMTGVARHIEGLPDFYQNQYRPYLENELNQLLAQPGD